MVAVHHNRVDYIIIVLLFSKIFHARIWPVLILHDAFFRETVQKYERATNYLTQTPQKSFFFCHLRMPVGNRRILMTHNTF